MKDARPPTRKILIVEDDRRIAEMVRSAVEREGFDAEVVLDGQTALTKLRTHPPDLVVLDRGLPGVDGMTVLRELRKSGHTPVLVLTARDQEEDIIQAFQLGADDYVTKPFGTGELMVRIQSLFRRSPLQSAPTLCVDDRLQIQTGERQVIVDGATIEITRTEFDLLLLFASNPGVVFSRERLLEQVWGFDFEGFERTVDSHITRIRRKIERDHREPRYLQTVWGVGYQFKLPGD